MTQMNLIYETEADSQTERTDLQLPQEEGRGGTDWELAISKCKHVEWKNNKELLYITGNYFQYPMITYNGKEYEEECIYFYIYHLSI